MKDLGEALALVLDPLALQRRDVGEDELERLGEVLHPPICDIVRAGWTKPGSFT